MFEIERTNASHERVRIRIRSFTCYLPLDTKEVNIFRSAFCFSCFYFVRAFVCVFAFYLLMRAMNYVGYCSPYLSFTLCRDCDSVVTVGSSFADTAKNKINFTQKLRWNKRNRWLKEQTGKLIRERRQCRVSTAEERCKTFESAIFLLFALLCTQSLALAKRMEWMNGRTDDVSRREADWTFELDVAAVAATQSIATCSTLMCRKCNRYKFAHTSSTIEKKYYVTFSYATTTVCNCQMKIAIRSKSPSNRYADK